MAKRRSHRKVHRGRRTKRGFSTWSLGKKIGVIMLTLFLTIIIGGGAAAAAFLNSKVEKIDIQKLDADALEINKEVVHRTGYLNVALFGVDSRDASLGVGTRSDTIMIASLNQETGDVKLASVYRDTLLQQSDGTYNKANAAYSFGGVEGAVALLNKNLDMDIQHYVTVNFDALIDVVDAIGGVDIDVQEEEISYICGYMMEIMKVTGREGAGVTEPGLQTLTGLQATAYCRIRYTKGDDFRRTERQREVLTQIVQKLQSSNLATLNKVIDSVFDEVGTSFTLPEILAYAKDYKHYKLVETTGFPFSKTTATLSGIGSTVIPVDLANNVVQLHQFFYGEDGYTPSSTVNTIAAGVKAKSGDVKAATEEELANYKSTDETDADKAVEERVKETTNNSDTKKSNSSSNTKKSNNSGNEGGNTGRGNEGGNAGGGNNGGNEGGNTGGNTEGGNAGGGNEGGNEASGGGESDGE